MTRTSSSRFDLTAAATKAREFAMARDWEQYHSIKNLTMALGGEVGELFELFQWKGDEEISSMLASDEGRRQIEEEIADIAIYLLRIAQQADIDLARAIRDKFRVNEAKYPVEMAKGSAKKYSELGNS